MFCFQMLHNINIVDERTPDYHNRAMRYIISAVQHYKSLTIFFVLILNYKMKSLEMQLFFNNYIVRTGLQALHEITSSGSYQLRPDLEDWESNYACLIFAVYAWTGFAIGKTFAYNL